MTMYEAEKLEETLAKINDNDSLTIYCYKSFKDDEFDKIELDDMVPDPNVNDKDPDTNVRKKMSEEKSVVSLSLANQQLKIFPDDLIAGTRRLEKLDLSCNVLTTLPDSIGMLVNLKVLDVSRNNLSTLPESISQCRSLEEFDASFNNLMFLPNNFGHGLVNLKKLLLQLNKIRYLPVSISEMVSLAYMDVHFNDLHGLPYSTGELKNLEVLNLSGNFNTLTSIPVTIGELTNLKELDLSNNQIRALPNSISQLLKITKLNLDQNPLVTPPVDITANGIGAVMMFMTRRYLNNLATAKRVSAKAQDDSWSSQWHGALLR